jgi:hypothetical protein
MDVSIMIEDSGGRSNLRKDGSDIGGKREMIEREWLSGKCRRSSVLGILETNSH